MQRPRTASRRRQLVAGVAAAATGFATLAALGPAPGWASSHREAPYIAGDPRADNTDVYAFVSPDAPDSVTFIANWWPMEEPDGGPNFYRFADGAAYDIEIDNNADAVVDIIYRWVFESSYRNGNTFLYNTGVVSSFDDPDLNFRQTYDLLVSRDGGATFTTAAADQPVAPSNVGPASMPNYAQLRQEAVRELPGGAGRSFAGQADDPFFLDLRIFDLLYGGDLSLRGNDTLNGYNVQSIALQVPKSALAAQGNPTANPVIGIFSTTSRPGLRTLNPDGTVTESGAFAQVSRLGNPLVNEVVVPVGLKDAFNNSRPSGDGDFLGLVQDPEVPRLIESIYDIPAPATPRTDLVQVFLTGVPELTDPAINEVVTNPTPSEMLRLNMSIAPTRTPARLGVLGGDLAGFPNGRRLTDDVVDIGLKALQGALLGADTAAFTDQVDANDVPFANSFPYVALPHNSAVNLSEFSGFNRLAGDDRFATAATIARETFRGAQTAVLVNGADEAFPDALTANYVAGDRNGPLLLTTRDSTPEATMRALTDLGVRNVVLVGGTARISQAQQDALARQFVVTRIAGGDRFATARAAALEPGAANVGQATAVIANGFRWPDALVAGPLAYAGQFPILLTAGESLSPDARATIRDLGIKRVIIAGGPVAVSPETEATLVKDLGVEVVRLGGADRGATSIAIAQFAVGELGFNPTHVNLARGDVPADTLAGGPHAGVERSAIVMTVSPTVLGNAVTEYLARSSIALERGHVYGGPNAVTEPVVAAARDAANSND
ncbi:putative cell wall binding repeat protein [Kineococcus xinjiangensis]|uniref:Putative cell wall binding repeat protein n=1 Tax=Kineococcus xinjiangensis TaxID=512762 RepID=A0A2S6IP51_9ACTN|nr:DUF4331 family protein [Kineococcus xinjiangensis]PPK95945.1 putative cell wall binding repeat protein [Kineococcus xinjiangensis]